MKSLLLLTPIFLLASCVSREIRTIGSIERLDPALDKIITPDAVIEIIGEGYVWSEGPLWIPAEETLLFSDVPANVVFSWKEDEGVTSYLSPSGYTGEGPSRRREPGSNGLVLDPDGKLVLCQHGDRRLARMDAPLSNPAPTFITVAGQYQGKKFNSPNDAVYRSNGDLFFTDPPYGLPDSAAAARELDFHGVFKVTRTGDIALLVDTITRPNGIGFTPDEKTLLVANSDPAKPVWYAFDFTETDSLANARVFYDASDAVGDPGLPDGFKIDRNGNVFASGPGGIWIFNKNAKLLGKIRLPEPASNCAFADGEKTLFITSKQYLLRVRMK